MPGWLTPITRITVEITGIVIVFIGIVIFLVIINIIIVMIIIILLDIILVISVISNCTWDGGPWHSPIMPKRSPS